MSGKLTRNQKLVLDALTRDGGAMSAYAILDELRPNGFRAPLQVYRALDRLIEAGQVHRIESRNAFIACSDGEHTHGIANADPAAVAFLLCDGCGLATEVADPALVDRLARLAAEAGFAPRHSMVEIRGRCADCTAAGEPSTASGAV